MSGKAEGTQSPKAAVIIVNTNELHHLKKCLPTVTKQTYSRYEVLVVDNNSTDGSVEYIGENFPSVRVIQNKANLGFPAANNVGFQNTDAEFLAALNPDTEVEPTWLSELIAALQTHPEAGLVTSQILLMSNREKINTCGNEVSLTGFVFCRGLEMDATDSTSVEEVAAVSGAAFAIRREVLDKIGGFDGDLWLYVEDTDLSWRTRLAGYICLFVPTSVAYHQYGLRLTDRKFFHYERNRHLLLLKNLSVRTLFVLAPSLIFSEIITWGYALLKGKGYVAGKLRGYQWLIQHRRQIIAKRQEAQSLRKICDRELLDLCTVRLPFDQADGRIAGRVAQTILGPMHVALHRITLALI
jgi:GT2 family glycosyltransferase